MIPAAFPAMASSANIDAPVPGKVSDANAMIVGHIHPTKKPINPKANTITMPDAALPATTRHPAQTDPARISIPTEDK